MNVAINGQIKEYQSEMTLSQILEEIPHAKKNTAILLNGHICRENPPIKEGDEIEIIAFVGGGSQPNGTDPPLMRIADLEISSRLLVGTGKYGSMASMMAAIEGAKPAIVTVALKRIDLEHPQEDIFTVLRQFPNLIIMPNTSGAKNCEEAYQAAWLGREISGSRFVKIEIHPDNYHLMPDPIETFLACQRLIKEGFIILPYIQADPILAKRLQDIGVQAVMPLGSTIGSGQGLVAREFIKIIIHQANVPVIVDAGIRSPADAALAMEIGADAVLVNTALALSDDSFNMGRAFAMAVTAGHLAYRSGIMQSRSQANATSLTSFLGS